MAIQKYRYGNTVPILGIVWLVVLVVVGGSIIGGLFFAIDHLIYIPFLFPFGVGAVGAILVGEVVRKRKVSSPFVAGMFGLMMGLVIYGTYHCGGYLEFRKEDLDTIAAQLEEHYDQVGDEDVARVFDLIMLEETGSPGFLGYLKWTADAGFSIVYLMGNTFPLELPIRSGWAWLYWILELGLVSGPAIVLPLGAARKPFCHHCRKWYDSSEYIGDVAEASAERFLGLLEAGDLVQAGELIDKEEETVPGNLEVKAQLCPCSTSDVVLEIARPTLGAQNQIQRKRVLRGMISAQQYSILLQTMPDREEE